MFLTPLDASKLKELKNLWTVKSQRLLLIMDDRKKRGSNYTAAEKDILLELVKKFHHFIENKETNANMILKKRNAWNTVCQQYNAVAMSGNRTWQQLRHLYENLKQRSKKKLAIANRLHCYDKTKEIKKEDSLDKKAINCTGGGAYKSTITDQDAQILAMAAPQIKPLPNPYDDAALNFDYHNNMAKSSGNRTIISDGPGPRKPIPRETNNLKKQYFKQKLLSSKLEYKYLQMKNKREIEKHKIEMEILRIRLKKLKRPRQNKCRNQL